MTTESKEESAKEPDFSDISNGLEKTVEHTADKEQPEPLPEPALQPESADSGTDKEQPEPLPEPAADVGLELQTESVDVGPESQPELSCNSGTNRACYPVGKTGCTVNGVGKYECKGICATGTEACVNGAWSGQCTGATEPIVEICNSKDDDCDGNIDNGCRFLWATSVGDRDDNYGFGIAVDGSENIYIVGRYSETVNFGTTTLTAKGSRDILVAKISSQGNFLWAISAGGTGNDYGRSIAVDGSGNIYITGYYYGTATFGGVTLSSKGNYDIFVAKVSNQGMFLWATSVGGTVDDYAFDIAVDVSGNSYITGSYSGTASFGTTTLTSKGNKDVFVAKVSNQGTFLWAASAGGTDVEEGFGIAVDGSGDSYITGSYAGTVIFGTTTFTAKGSLDIFVAKVSNQGVFLWATSAGGIGNDSASSITIDSSGNSYITGFYSDTARFGTAILTSQGNKDILVAKVSSQGVFLWATSAGGMGNDSASELTIDGSGNIYITGFYNGTANFGTTTLTSQGGDDIFVAKVSSQGIFQWATSAGGTSGDYGGSIAVDGSGNIYITAVFAGTASVGSTTFTSKGGVDMIVAKLR